ncbi:pre-mRNA processing factor 3-domain-containing protein [Lipomyces oligophaga]|uniref:pre-mRNA processing factor 3-domain-containing protein n=1 Tax=Lipomyces oligophaga TaxID=45792 RepID=UPI0034CD82B1
MASPAADVRKRHLDPDDVALSSSSSTKKSRSNEQASQEQGAVTASPAATDVIARARAIAREKASAAAKKIAERLEASKAGAISKSTTNSTSSSSTAPSPSSSSGIDMKALLAQIAAKRAQVSATLNQRSTTPASKTSTSPQSQVAPTQSSSREELDRARGGLNVGLHPALLGNTASSFASTFKSKRGQNKVNKYLAPVKDDTNNSSNPYYDATLDMRPRDRTRRALVFNEQGKFIEQAEEVRKQAKLEELKKRILEDSKRAGVSEDVDPADLALKRQEPPEVEWWDQGLLSPGASYEDVSSDPSKIKIDTSDSVISIYIQHPIPIAPPWDSKTPMPRPPYLTKREMKRIRKSERAERHKDKQDRIRLGLDPAPAPKVKLSNLMSVLTNEAIRDPTLVETRVRREMEERKQAHVKDNEARKLTAEQRHEKLQTKLEQDEQRGIIGVMFRIAHLNPQNSYKVNVNAREFSLKGVALSAPSFTLVVAEGGSRAIKLYKKLLLNRIDWTSTGEVVSTDQIETENKCELVWEGQLKQHQFRRWISRALESDSEAREMLEKMNCLNYWNLAKNWQSNEF